MATALKLKRDINKLKAAIKSKATPQSYVPKLKAQLQKAEADYESVKAGKKSAPKASKQVKSTLDKLKAIIKKKKYGAYRAQGVDLEKDADRPALRSGKRISKNGNTYYEYRANRIDVKQPPKRYPKLEDGGMMAKGGMVDYSKDGYVKAIRDAYGKLLKEVKIGDDIYRYNSVYKTYNSIKNNELLHKSKYADGGMMAEGGFFDKKEDVVFKFQEGEKIKVLQYSGGKLKPLEATIYKQYAAEQPDGTYYPFYWTVGSWEDFEEGKKHPSLYAEDELIERHKNKPKMADGGEIKNQYENMSPKQVWEKWNSNQREHFVSDHYEQWNGSWSEDKKSLPKLSFEKVIKKVPNFESALIRHIDMGQYASGGYMADGGEMVYNYVKIKNYPTFQTEEEAKKFIKIGKPFLRKELKEGKIVLVYNGKEYFLADVKEKMADGGTIDNSGITPADLQKQIWNLTSRIAKLGDIESQAASDEIEMLMKQRKKLQSMALNHGDVVMAQGGELHRSQEEKFKYGGYMEKGGNTDETQEIFFFVKPRMVSELTQKANNEKVELEFIETNEDGNEVYRAELTDSQINDFTKLPLQYDFNYDYAKGGYMAKGGNTDETQEIFFFVKPRMVSELTQKANNEKVELEFIETNEDGNEVYRAELTDSQINDFTKLPLQYDFNYDYAKGGYMAKGGATQHGLKRGDTIWADQFWENTVIVDNPETGRAVVNLETGKRKEQGKI